MKKEDRAAVRMERMQANESRRIAVDEKRVELEKRGFAEVVEERNGMIAEMKEVLSVLSGLVKKQQ